MEMQDDAYSQETSKKPNFSSLVDYEDLYSEKLKAKAEL